MQTTKFIHPIRNKDILFFKRLCDENSCFFSDSEAFVDSYLSRDRHFCYNDGRNIFFFGRFGNDTYSFCSPKGINWQDRMFEVIFDKKNSLKKGFKKIWLWELSEPINRSYLDREKFKSVNRVVNKRYISYLPDYRNTEQFLKRKDVRKIRQQRNRFFNNLDKQNYGTQISCESLTRNNYKDSLKVLNRWRTYIREDEFTDGQIISKEHVFRKDLKMIKNVLKKPKLYESLLLYLDYIPLGINIAFKLGKTRNLSGGVFCADRTIPGTSETLYLLFFEKLAKKGYQYYNWGNSYLSSIDYFKRKFCPRNYEYSYEYLIDFKNCK